MRTKATDQRDSRKEQEGFALIFSSALIVLFLSVGILVFEYEKINLDSRGLKLISDSTSHAAVTCFSPTLFAAGDVRYQENWLKARTAVTLLLNRNRLRGVFDQANVGNTVGRSRPMPPSLCDPAGMLPDHYQDECYGVIEFANYSVDIRRGLFYYDSANQGIFEPLDADGFGNLTMTPTTVTCPADAGAACSAGSTLPKWEVANAVYVSAELKDRPMTPFFKFIGIANNFIFRKTSVASIVL